MKIEKQKDRDLLLQMYLQGDGLPLEHALKNTALCALNALEILRCILAARFELRGVNADIPKVSKGL